MFEGIDDVVWKSKIMWHFASQCVRHNCIEVQYNMTEVRSDLLCEALQDLPAWRCAWFLP